MGEEKEAKEKADISKARKEAIDALCDKQSKHKNVSPFLFAGLVAAFFYAAVISYFLLSEAEYALPKALCCFGGLTAFFYPVLFWLFPGTQKSKAVKGLK